MEKELTNEEEIHLWEVINFKPQTLEERNEENYIFLKNLYWDLILHFIKKGNQKNVEFFQNSWKEVEAQYITKINVSST
jgi:hypothetical protein